MSVKPWTIGRQNKKPEIWGIVDPDGLIRAVAFDKYQAWYRFFDLNAHKLPIEEAKRAYEAIGFRCACFSLVEISEAYITAEAAKLPIPDVAKDRIQGDPNLITLPQVWPSLEWTICKQE